MIKNKRVLSLIPARGGSKGLLRKNIRPLHGKPLVGWPIESAKKSKYVDKVLVSTDDKEIANVSKKYKADVPFLRPGKFAQDDSHRNEVIMHTLDYLEKTDDKYDYLVYLEPTSPLTTAKDIDDALEILIKNKNIAYAIVGVCKLESTHPQFTVSIDENGLIKPFLDDSFNKSIRRQDISDLYFFDGSLYISDIEYFLKEKEFYHDRTLPYIVPKWKSFEIDDIIDFVCIEAIMKNLDKIIDESDTNNTTE